MSKKEQLSRRGISDLSVEGQPSRKEREGRGQDATMGSEMTHPYAKESEWYIPIIPALRKTK